MRRRVAHRRTQTEAQYHAKGISLKKSMLNTGKRQRRERRPWFRVAVPSRDTI
jgi:hypothetical protein